MEVGLGLGLRLGLRVGLRPGFGLGRGSGWVGAGASGGRTHQQRRRRGERLAADRAAELASRPLEDTHAAGGVQIHAAGGVQMRCSRYGVYALHVHCIHTAYTLHIVPGRCTRRRRCASTAARAAGRVARGTRSTCGATARGTCGTARPRAAHVRYSASLGQGALRLRCRTARLRHFAPTYMSTRRGTAAPRA